MNPVKIFSRILTILIVFGIFILISSVYTSFFEYDNNCLKEKAKEICNEKEYQLDHFGFSGTWYIECVPDFRSLDKISYKFLEEELEECRK